MNIADLPNLGPRSQQILAQAGSHTGQHWQQVAKHERLCLLSIPHYSKKEAKEMISVQYNASQYCILRRYTRRAHFIAGAAISRRVYKMVLAINALIKFNLINAISFSSTIEWE